MVEPQVTVFNKLKILKLNNMQSFGNDEQTHTDVPIDNTVPWIKEEGFITKQDGSNTRVSENLYKVASKGKRILNLLIDSVSYYVFALLVGLLLGFAGAGELLSKISKSYDTLFGYAIIAAYYLLFEGIFQKTIGKFITRTKVVMRKDGSKPDFKHICYRTFSRFIPFDALSFLFSSSENVEKSGWHDSLSGTIVVENNQLRSSRLIYTDKEKNCIYCQSCGTKIPKDSEFCPQCGNKIIK
jgi:uncharacterized RDD family membrane protein YckC